MDDIHQDNERHLVENYIKLYCLEELLDETVNTVLEKRPENPYIELARLIENKSMAEIMDVIITGSLGEKGRGAVTTTVITNIGEFCGTFGLPTKSFIEGEELMKDYSIAAGKINDAIKGMDPRNFKEIDDKLCGITNLHPSICISVNIACARAGAKHRGLPLYRYLAEFVDPDGVRIPVPVATAVLRSTSGRISNDGIPLMQDITLTPTTSGSFENAIEALNTATNVIKKAFIAKNTPISLHSERGAIHVVMNSLDDVLQVSYRSLYSFVLFTIRVLVYILFVDEISEAIHNYVDC